MSIGEGPIWIAAGVAGMLLVHGESREFLELLKLPELRMDIRLTPPPRHEVIIPEHGLHAETRGPVTTRSR